MTGKILVVEDEDSVRDSIAELLELDGYTVVAARHGQEALDALAGGAQPNLIVLDLMMPVLNGWEFREAQRSSPDIAGIPVLLLSGAGGLDAEAAALGAAAYIEKPFDPECLLRTVARHIGAA